ncbi:hypothetical protein C7H84_19910 [Burkholderia sp. Nafp2/4-1b]|nr:hypothetical protein C7H84_19910 [Burkholderia sp. Nafp2/4-1b]
MHYLDETHCRCILVPLIQGGMLPKDNLYIKAIRVHVTQKLLLGLFTDQSTSFLNCAYLTA